MQLPEVSGKPLWRSGDAGPGRLPQALRVSLPSLVNEFINLLKATSLAYVISLREIMAVVNDAIAASFRFVEWYCAALVYYLIIVSLFMIAQSLIQKRLN